MRQEGTCDRNGTALLSSPLPNSPIMAIAIGEAATITSTSIVRYLYASICSSQTIRRMLVVRAAVPL